MEEIKIPEGTKSMTCNIEGNKVIIEFIPKEKFKDGDILASAISIVIYNGVRENEAIVCYGGLNVSWSKFVFYDTPSIGFGDTECYRLATEEEKQKLFDAMAKEGLKWNAENKKVEKIRWRAKYMGYYYHIDTDGKVRGGIDTGDAIFDDDRYEFGNYFKTEEEAIEKSEQIKKILKGE